MGHPILRKLWLASRILGGHTAGGPFGKRLVEHTPAEIDFILEMGALDEPEKYTFLRDGRDPRREAAEARVAWFDTLTGAALEEKKAEDGLTDAQKRLAAYRSKATRAPPGMKPGMTRGGKVIDAGH